MGLVELCNLNKDQARALLDDYWSARERFLQSLDHIASELGVPLGSDCDRFGLPTIDLLDEVVEECVTHPELIQHVDEVPEWLRELHDPIDENAGLSNGEIWLGLAASFVVTCIVLRRVKGAELAIGDAMVKKYINQNQPVIKGRWYDEGIVDEVSAIAISQSAVRGIKEYGEKRIYRRSLDKVLAWAARTRAINDVW